MKLSENVYSIGRSGNCVLLSGYWHCMIWKLVTSNSTYDPNSHVCRASWALQSASDASKTERTLCKTHFMCVCVLVAQLCSTLCDPMDCNLRGSSVHGILQARTLEWTAIPFSRGSSWPRDQTQASCIAGRLFTVWATRPTLKQRILEAAREK